MKPLGVFNLMTCLIVGVFLNFQHFSCAQWSVKNSSVNVAQNWHSLISVLLYSVALDHVIEQTVSKICSKFLTLKVYVRVCEL